MEILVELKLRVNNKKINEYSLGFFKDEYDRLIEELDCEIEENEDCSFCDSEIEFEERYILNVKIILDDGSNYDIIDYFVSSFDLDDLETALLGIDTIGTLYDNLIDNENIGNLDEYFSNNWEYILNDMFETPEQAVLSVLNGDYNYNDDYVYFNGYRNLVSTNNIPFEDYSEEIFERWLEENSFI